AVGSIEHRFDADVLVTCGGFRPANELCSQALGAGDVVLETPPPPSIATPPGFVTTLDGMRVFVVGNAAAIGDLRRARLEGTIAGLEAALALRGASPALRVQLDDER